MAFKSSRWTLDDYIIDLFRKNQTNTPEFKIMLGVFGRDRMEKIWFKYQELLRNNQLPNPPTSPKNAETTQNARGTQTTHFDPAKANSFASRCLPDEDW
jgi:hypothetical protein